MPAKFGLFVSASQRWRIALDGVLAEGVGFEPTRGLHPWRFSRPLP
jgi:hypothetical protein